MAESPVGAFKIPPALERNKSSIHFYFNGILQVLKFGLFNHSFNLTPNPPRRIA